MITDLDTFQKNEQGMYKEAPKKYLVLRPDGRVFVKVDDEHSANDVCRELNSPQS